MFSIYHEPRIIKNFITHEECEYLKSTENGLFVDSLVQSGIPSLKRKSKSKVFLDENHYVIKEVSNKVSELTKTPLPNIEFLQITKYETGGFYKTHFDSALPGPLRPFTVIIYLNDNYIGGETYFPRINKKYKLNRCDALLFNNYDTSGNISQCSLHSGEPIITGEKWICSAFVNENRQPLFNKKRT